MKNNKLFIASFIANLLVFLLVVTGTIVMFTLGSAALAGKGFTVFKYFTFQSNIFMGAIAFIYAYYQLLILKNKVDKIPHLLQVMNLVAVAAVSLTFVVVILVLSPVYGFPLMFNNANLFFHGIVPVLAMLNYMFLEKECRVSFKETFFTAIPCAIYGIVYFIAVASLNGYGNINIDFYMFGAQGPYMGILYYFVVVSVALALGMMLYFVNKLVFKKAR